MGRFNLVWAVLIGRGAIVVPLLISALVHYRKHAARVRAHITVVLLERLFGVYVGKGAIVGPGLKTPHPIGIVIGDGVTLGSNVTLYQGTTLGAVRAGEGKKGLYPTIEDGAILFSGVSVLGDVTVGRNAVIGANSLVLFDVPSGAVAVGAPARIVKTRSSDE